MLWFSVNSSLIPFIQITNSTIILKFSVHAEQVSITIVFHLGPKSSIRIKLIILLGAFPTTWLRYCWKER